MHEDRMLLSNDPTGERKRRLKRMHDMAVVMVPESITEREPILDYIERVVAPHKIFFPADQARVCECLNQNKQPLEDCEWCGGTGETQRNPEGRFDYWILGGRFHGVLRHRVSDPDHSVGDFFDELRRSLASSNGGSFSYDEHDSIAENVVSFHEVHPAVVIFVYLDLQGRCIDVPRGITVRELLQDHPGYQAAAIDIHDYSPGDEQAIVQPG